MEFKKYTVEELVKLNMLEKPMDGNHGGKHPTSKDYVEKGIPFIMVSDINKGKINYKSCKFISKETRIGLDKGFSKPNDVLLSHKATIGLTAIVGNEYEEIVLTPQLTYYRVKEGINNKYLKYYFDCMYFQNILNNWATSGSTRAYVGITAQLKLPILLPGIIEQNKIAKILFDIDKKIELNNQINDNLQKLINNLYIKYFINFDEYTGEYKNTELGMIPRSFEVDRLGNVITFSNGYGWNSKDMLDEGIENSYKVFKMGNINIGGGINKSKTKSWIKKEKVEGLEQYISKKGDILMCMTDMKNSGNPLLGHTALIDRDSEFIINQRVGIIRCEKKLDYTYIYTMSNLKHFIDDIRSRANSGVQVNLTTKGICDTLILVPDDNTLIKFQQVAKPLYEKIFNNNNENETLEIMRDSLLPKLMNGEIDLDKVDVY